MACSGLCKSLMIARVPTGGWWYEKLGKIWSSKALKQWSRTSLRKLCITKQLVRSAEFWAQPKTYWIRTCNWINPPGWRGPRWWCRKILNSPSPMDMLNLQLHTDHFSSEKDLNTRWTLPYNKGYRTTSRQIGEIETQSWQKPYPRHRDTQKGRISLVQCFSWRSEGWVSYIRHSNLWSLHWKDELLKMLILENQWGCHPRNPVCYWKLRFSHVGSLAPGSSTKNTNRKITWVVCKGDSFAGLGAPARGEGNIWGSQQGQRHWWMIFMCFSPTY